MKKIFILSFVFLFFFFPDLNVSAQTNTSCTGFETSGPCRPELTNNGCVAGTSNGNGQCSAYINSQLRTVSYCVGNETSGPCRPDRINKYAAEEAAKSAGPNCRVVGSGFPGVDPNTALGGYYQTVCGDSSIESTWDGGVSNFSNVIFNRGDETYKNLMNYMSSTTSKLLNSVYKSGEEMLGFRPVVPPTVNTGGACYVFLNNLRLGSSGPDVVALTSHFKAIGLASEAVSTITSSVELIIKRFQEAQARYILTPFGLTQGTGIVGEKTREYLNSICVRSESVTPVSPSRPPMSCLTPLRSGKQNGKYTYTFSKNSNNTWTVTLNNPAYSVPSDRYYIKPNFSFIAINALDLNRQNQAWFNYSPSSLPGTPEGHAEYQAIFGSFNNAYYDWNNMTKDASSCTPSVSTSTPPTTGNSIGINPPPPVLQTISNQVRYVKVSIADWDTLPLAVREITIQGLNNTIIRPVSISTTNFDALGYYPPANAIDGNENTIWRATKSTSTCVTTDPTAGRGADIYGGRACQVDGDLQVLTIDLGKVYTVDRIKVMNYGSTDTRVFVVEVSQDGNRYTQVEEFRAQQSAPIADKGVFYAVIRPDGSMGPFLPQSVSTPPQPGPSCYVFRDFLRLNSTGSDVLALTTQLKKEGFLNQVTSMFDFTVQLAVKRFQEAHAAETLTPLGITEGTGLVLGKTIEYLNNICVAY